MKMLRTSILVLCLIFVGFIALRLWVRQVSTPRTPRPIFHQWEERDQGWKWANDGPVTDQFGNWLYADKTLNFLAVIATLDPSFTGSLDYYQPTYAVIHAESRYETRLDSARDALVIVIPGKANRAFRIDHGLAASLYAEFFQKPPYDCVSELLSRYRGPDGLALKAFVDANIAIQNITTRASAEPPSSEPAGHLDPE